MNTTTRVDEQWYHDIQFGNLGASVFIVTYIGLYGLGIICFFGHQLKETQRQRGELPAYFLKTLWDVPSKNKLYEELADMERLKRIFRGYFADHESYVTINNEELQAIVEERAYACAIKYREKLRRLHLAHTDYYLDTVHRLSTAGSEIPEQSSPQMASTRTTIGKPSVDFTNRDDYDYSVLSVTVV